MPVFNPSYSGAVAAQNTATRDGSIQTWVVPSTGTYRIVATGAQGGATGSGEYGGKGAVVAGDFALTAGQTLKIIVGQKGSFYSSGGGGGGGSFVWVDGQTVPLIVAGGGGGGVSNTFGGNASTTETTSPVSGNSSTGGAGGSHVYTTGGAGGAGWNANGSPSGTQQPNMGGKRPLDPTNPGQGGIGGSCGASPGGFGGGGGGEWCTNGAAGGGGGYSGGWSMGNQSNPCSSGGASFNSGTNPTAAATNASGHGLVAIRSPLDPSVLLGGNAGWLYSSDNGGANWTISTQINTANDVKDIAYSPKLHRTVAVSRLNGLIWTSEGPMGGFWTSRTSPVTSGFHRLIWAPGPGLFVVVGENGVLLTSPDGITWTQRTVGNWGTAVAIAGVAWSPTLGMFVITGSTRIATSTDGITWTNYGQLLLGNGLSVEWLPKGTGAGGGFVIGQSSGYIHTSTDGLAWTQRTNPYGTTYGCLCAAGNPSGTVMMGLTSGYAITSADGGATWTQRGQIIGVGNNVESALYVADQGKFYASASNLVRTSTDAITWTTVLSGSSIGTPYSLEYTQFTAPTAPTGVTATPSTVKVGDPVTISWTHNDPDQNPQVKYQLRWRKTT